MNLHLGQATKILMQTLPYVIIRAVIYAAIGLAVAVYIGLLALIAKIFGGGGAIVMLIGLGILAGILRLVKEYVLYIVKAGHVAVITELIHHGSLPPGINQFQWGKQQVTELFKEVSILFALDRLVDGVIRGFNRTIVRIADILPIPGLEGLMKIVNAVLYFSLTYVDETILSYNLSRRDGNFWESARRGVILYAQNWKPILTSAAGITAVNFIGFIIVLIVFLIPFGSLAMLTTSQGLKFFWFALAFTLAWGFKAAVFSPLFLTSIILTFNESIEGQEPNPQLESTLEDVSEKFRDLKRKAIEHLDTRRGESA